MIVLNFNYSNKSIKAFKWKKKVKILTQNTKESWTGGTWNVNGARKRVKVLIVGSTNWTMVAGKAF